MVRLSEQLLSASRVSAMGAARLGATGTGLSCQMMTTNGTITHPDHRGA
ncbi:hypothetical protein [Geothrix fuzhouensis]|nr:hypothetical protein [Geothrix fuzhouensis]